MNNFFYSNLLFSKITFILREIHLTLSCLKMMIISEKALIVLNVCKVVKAKVKVAKENSFKIIDWQKNTA